MSEYKTVLTNAFIEVKQNSPSEKIEELRINGLVTVARQIACYKNYGYIDFLLDAIAKKKTERLLHASTKEEVKRIVTIKAPHFDGNRFIENDDIIPEEELILWRETSLKAPLNEYGYQRYMELFRKVFPTYELS